MTLIYEIFGWPLGWLMWLAYKIIDNYGIALIVFTVVLKLCMLPLEKKRHLAMAKQRVFQPKVREIQQKYKDNKEKQQQEFMKLQQQGYSMTGGCSSTLIQFPILFGLIDVIYRPMTHILRLSSDVIEAAEVVAAELGDAVSGMSSQIALMKSIIENPDMYIEAVGSDVVSSVQAINFNFLGWNLTEVPEFALNWLVVLPCLMALTMILQTFILQKINPMAGQSPDGKTTKSMNVMMYSMAIIFIPIGFSVPAGVSLYYVMSSTFMICQSLIMYKVYPPLKVAEEFAVEVKAKAKAQKEAQKEAAKKTIVREKIDGKVVEVEKDLSLKEIDKMRLAKARELDNEKYGE